MNPATETRLDPLVYQDPRWCADCGGMKRFFVLYETDFGRVGICEGCEQLKIAYFSRATSEAA